MTEHVRFNEDIAAYLLGALDENERTGFERHLATCDECREELERLRPAAELLPGSVEQIEPPPGLKAALMAEVEPRKEPVRRPFFRRPVLRVALVAAAVGLLIGIGVSQISDEQSRTLVATVDEAMPRAGGDLRVSGDGATLRLHDMPDLGERRVYQVWLQHGDEMVPARTFEVGTSGIGEVELPEVSDADGVYVTREPRGGAKVPSEDPIVSVPL